MGWATPVSNGNGGSFEKAPPGNHPAVLVAIVDTGSHEDKFEDEGAKLKRQLWFVYELVTKKVSGTTGRNHLIGVTVNWSMNEKATLRKWIEARIGRKLKDGEQYDITQELGRSVALQVSCKEGGWPKVDGVSALMEGVLCPPPQTTPVAWKLGDDLAALPPWLPYRYGQPIPDRIRESREMKGVPPAAPAPSARPRMGAKPASPPTEPPGPASRWNCYDDQQGEWVPMTAADLEQWYQDAKVNPADIRVYPDGASPAAAKPAVEYGFPALSPF